MENISNAGLLYLNNSVFISNTAIPSWGIINGAGAGIANSGKLIVNNTSFNNGSALYGGAISGELTVNNSNFNNGNVSNSASAIYLYNSYNNFIYNSTFTNNIANVNAGCIMVAGSNCTLINNRF